VLAGGSAEVSASAEGSAEGWSEVSASAEVSAEGLAECLERKR
jgi:hypothetical protein